MNENKTDALMELLTQYEPKWTTHSQSIWNRVRREIEAINGNVIPSHYSWDHDEKKWVL